MNTEMAYLLGMICGNGEIRRELTESRVSIDIPHKKLETEEQKDVLVYVKASIADIRSILEPLVGAGIEFIQSRSATILSFRKPNDNYLMREIMRFIGDGTSHDNIRLNQEVFNFTYDEKLNLLRGFADVTGYIRRSNYFFKKHMHRVYLEVPNNWYLVIDICNLLKDVDIPVQNIDWAHPNTRDPKLNKYNEGKPNFWKKEHQIKIFANEFEPVGFAVIHKKEALYKLSNELKKGLENERKEVESTTHKYYWEGRKVNKNNPYHPGVNDEFIVKEIRGTNYNSWRDIAKELGYGK